MVNEIIETQNTTHTAPVNNNKPRDKIDENPQINGVIVQQTANKRSTLKIHAKALPIEVVKLLEDSQVLLKSLKDCESYFEGDKTNLISDTVLRDFENFKISLEKAFNDSNWDSSIVKNIWSFGPKRCGPNILVNEVTGYDKGTVWPCDSKFKESDDDTTTSSESRDAFNSNFVNGFQMATAAGPLCEEPMVGVCFVVEEWTMDVDDDSENVNLPFGPYSGQIMSAVKEGCRKAFQCQPQRLMVAMYSCNIQVNSEVLGEFN